jgi:hypothetical protein
MKKNDSYVDERQKKKQISEIQSIAILITINQKDISESYKKKSNNIVMKSSRKEYIGTKKKQTRKYNISNWKYFCLCK